MKMAKIEHERSAENATGQLHRVLAELDCARQQASRAQEETRTLESLLEGRKRDAADLEARGRVMQAELQKAGEQNALLKVEVENVSQSLTARNQEALQAETEKLRLQRELAELKAARNQLGEAESVIREEAAAGLRKDGELARLRREVQEKEAALMAKQEQLIDADDRLRVVVEERDGLMAELRQLGRSQEEMDSRVRRQVSAGAQENQRQAERVEAVRAESERLRRELEERTAALAQKGVDVEALESRVRTLEASLQTREVELVGLRDQLAAASARLDSETAVAAQSGSREKLVALELGAVQRKWEAARHEQEGLAAENARLAGVVADEQKRAGGLAEQVAQLKKLLGGVDSAKEELVRRLEQTVSERHAEGSEKARLGAEIERLAQERARALEEGARWQSKLRKLDESLDAMQEQLDAKTEALEGAQRRAGELEATVRDLESHARETGEERRRWGARLEERDNAVAQLEAKLRAASGQAEESRQAAGVKGRQVAQLEEEVLLLTQQNGRVSGELSRSAQGQDLLREQLAAEGERSRRLDEARRALELEKQDLLEQLQAACGERERSEGTARAVGAENGGLYARVEQLERERGALEGQLRDLGGLEQRYIRQTQTLESHIERLLRDKTRLEEELRRSHASTGALAQDAALAQQLQASLQHGSHELQRHVAELEHAKLGLLEREQEARLGTERVRSELECARSRAADLEGLLTQERRAQHAKDVRLRALDVSVAEARSELNRKDLRITSRRGGAHSLTALTKQLAELERPGGGQDRDREQLVHLIKEQEAKAGLVEQELKAKQGAVRELVEENERLKGYLDTYEKRVKELERTAPH